ncbi:hypothetical protein BLNAU_8057 [Blattamonas nauphoetae]|uniref:Secreted protein n=1 Tax=Blattamonas nauphoetae TaxID=2049346 RepID=A0ABQ9XZS7_9EUKA|nr:hypothetical protein BLNAU_8057 [Blattamonas nauphoetae]
MVLFAGTIRILSRQSRLMIATLSFSFAATFTLSHCPTARKWKLSMLTIGSGSSSVVDAGAMPFGMDPHRRSSSTLRKGDRIKMVVHAHHPMADLSPSRNELLNQSPIFLCSLFGSGNFEEIHTTQTRSSLMRKAAIITSI